MALADTEALTRLLLYAESVTSSRIEGLKVGGRLMLRAVAANALEGETNRRHRHGGPRKHPHDDVGTPDGSDGSTILEAIDTQSLSENASQWGAVPTCWL